MCACVCMCACACVYRYICIYIHLHIYVYICNPVFFVFLFQHWGADSILHIAIRSAKTSAVLAVAEVPMRCVPPGKC